MQMNKPFLSNYKTKLSTRAQRKKESTENQQWTELEYDYPHKKYESQFSFKKQLAFCVHQIK